MKRMRLPVIAALVSGICLLSNLQGETYEIDPVHSGVGFKIRHLFSKVPGRFNDFSGTIKFDRESPDKSSVEVTIKAASIDTGNEKRDNHLRSGDFFDVESHPEITFKSTSIERTGENSGKVTGDFTMHGVTKPVTLDVEFLGKGPGMQGEIRTGWKATTTLDRAEFGIEWNSVIEGTSVLGEKVDVELDIEAVKTGATAAE